MGRRYYGIGWSEPGFGRISWIMRKRLNVDLEGLFGL
jgi:hypothetical protein